MIISKILKLKLIMSWEFMSEYLIMNLIGFYYRKDKSKITYGIVGVL